jgi:hypothetical protein
VKADDFETTVLHVLFKYCQAFWKQGITCKLSLYDQRVLFAFLDQARRSPAKLAIFCWIKWRDCSEDVKRTPQKWK